MFKKGNFDSSFNGPIESVDDDNEKDYFFPLFAHESDSSRSTSSQTKREEEKNIGKKIKLPFFFFKPLDPEGPWIQKAP